MKKIIEILCIVLFALCLLKPNGVNFRKTNFLFGMAVFWYAILVFEGDNKR